MKKIRYTRFNKRPSLPPLVPGAEPEGPVSPPKDSGPSSPPKKDEDLRAKGRARTEPASPKFREFFEEMKDKRYSAGPAVPERDTAEAGRSRSLDDEREPYT